MKKKAFNQLLKSISGTNGMIDVNKANNLPQHTKRELSNHIISNGNGFAGIIIQLIPSNKEYLTWLACMGYMYIYTMKTTGYTFNCTCAGMVRLQSRDTERLSKGFPPIKPLQTIQPLPINCYL